MMLTIMVFACLFIAPLTQSAEIRSKRQQSIVPACEYDFECRYIDPDCLCQSGACLCDVTPGGDTESTRRKRQLLAPAAATCGADIDCVDLSRDCKCQEGRCVCEGLSIVAFECERNIECLPGATCIDGQCVPPPRSVECNKEKRCPSFSQICVNGKCLDVFCDCDAEYALCPAHCYCAFYGLCVPRDPYMCCSHTDCPSGCFCLGGHCACYQDPTN